jgi:hypothetical protein
MSRRFGADVLYGRRKGDAARPERPRMRSNRRSTQPTSSRSDARVDVGRHEARLLWQLVEDVVERTQAPAVETLLLDGSVAGSFAQTRSHGVVGRSETTLALGLPLLEALPASEVRALLAVELAGSGRKNGRKRAHGDDVQHAAEISGVVVLAAALVRSELVRRVLDEDYWPAVFHGAQSTAYPHVKPFTLVRRTLRAHGEAGALRAHAGQLFGVDADSVAGTPSLTERLRTLGVAPLEAVDAALLPVGAPAADLLGKAYEPLLARLDESWSEHVDAWWESAHEAALDEALGATATPAQTWTQATALARYSETFERVPTRR